MRTSNRYANLDTDLSDMANGLEILVEALRSPIISDADAILRSYIKTQSISKTAKAVWVAEIKQVGDKQYAAKDVSDIIKSAGKTGNSLTDAIGQKARSIFTGNDFRYKATSRHN